MTAPNIRPMRTVLLLSVALLAVCCSWPWIEILGWWPMAPDTGPWIERGDPSNPDWREWVFGMRHFQVGYRPLTALSFTAGTWLAGVNPLVVRGTDLALHLVGAVLLYAVLRRALGRTRGAYLGAALGLLLFLVHPAMEEVVPFSARRSYSLALLLGCAGLLVASGPAGAKGHHLLRGVGGGALLVMALFSNEVAVSPALFLPLLLLLGEPGPAPWASRLAYAAGRSILPAAAVLGGLYVRHQVVGGIGGYSLEEAGGDAGEIGGLLLGDLSGLAFLQSRGLGEAAGAAALIAWLAVFLVGLLWAAHGSQANGKRSWGAAYAAVLWAVLLVGLFTQQGVWFPRQTHPLVPALALGLGALVRAAVDQQGAVRLGAGLAGASVLGCALVGSPVVHGLQPERSLNWTNRQATIDTLVSAADLESVHRVLCVLPFQPAEDLESTGPKGGVAKAKLPRDARQPFLWARYVLRDEPFALREFLYVEELEPGLSEQRVFPVEGQARPSVRVPLDRQILLLKTRNPRTRKAARGELEALPSGPPSKGLPDYLFLYDGAGGALVPAPAKRSAKDKD